MANTIDFNVSTNAVTVLNQTATAADNTAAGFSSAKAELRALNNQLLQMDQSSEEFKKASKRAAELKDNISDLSAEINANAGNAFEGLSNNIGLFGSRLMDLDLAGAGQALKNMGSNVSRIDFKTLQKEVGGLIGGLASLGKAILANPILLLAGAIVAIIANFDDLIKLFPSVEKGLTGINEQERESLALSKAKADASQKAYENIDKQANILKLQGKSEREILNIKIKALETAIADRKTQLAITEKQAITQVQTAKRNREILEGIIRFLTAPLQLLLTAVDEIAKTIGVDSKLAEGFTDLAAGLLIDPQELETELNKTIEENKAAIATMENDYAGLKLSVKEMNKKAADDRKAAIKKENDEKERLQKEADEKELERRKKLNDELMAEDDRMQRIEKSLYKSKGKDKIVAEMEAHLKLTELRAQHSKQEVEELAKAEAAKAQLRVDALKTSLSILYNL
jgi:predicted  nucleic acid-binding Zn-ribbon protein